MVALPRIVAQPRVLLAVALTVLLATTLLAIGPVLATALAEGGLRAALEQADPADVGIEVEVRTTAERVPAAITAVGDALQRRLGDLVAVPDWEVRTGSVRLEGMAEDQVTLVVARGVSVPLDAEQPDGSLDLSGQPGPLLRAGEGGTVAEPTGAGLPVRLHEDALAPLGVAVGDVVAVEDGPMLEVVGTFAAVDPADPRWWDDPVGRDGVVPGQSFTTVGPIDPLGAPPGAVLGEDDPRVVVTLRTLPRLDVLRPETLVELGERARAARADVERAVAGGVADRLTMATPLADATVTSSFRLAATRAAVVATVAQVAVLALYTLGLAGRLLRSGREVETMLLRARGATPAQLGAAAAVEGLVVVAPAVLAAPSAAVLVVRAFGRLDVVTAAGLTLVPRTSVGATVAAAVAGAACLVLLVWPAVTAARATYAAARERRGRRRAVSLVQSSGADLALVVVAVVGVWQLRAAGGPVGGLVPRGPGDLDPVLVVGPALGLLAGAVLVLRLVPVIAVLGERAVQRRRGLVGSLSGWQVSRRPDAVSRPTLLLVLGVAIGVLATTYATTWTAAQRDQAAAAVGADAVVEVDRAAGALPAHDTATTITAVEHVTEAAPVWQAPISLAAGAPVGTTIAVDAGASLLLTRTDTAPTVPFEALDVPAVGGLVLPDGAELSARASLFPDPLWPGRSAEVALVVRDGDGLVHRLAPRTVAADDGRVTVAWSLAALRRPAALVAFEADVVAGDPTRQRYTGPFDPDAPQASNPVTPPELDLFVEGVAIDGQPFAVDQVAWSSDEVDHAGAAEPAAIDPVTVTGDGWRVTGDTGLAPALARTVEVRAVVSSSTAERDAAVPALVHPSVLDATGRAVGDQLAVAVRGTPLLLDLVGVAAVVPGALDEPFPVVIDVDAIAAARWARNRTPTTATSYQLDVAPPATGTPLAASRTLAARLGGGEVRAPTVRTTVLDTAARSRDPIAVGLLVALTLGAVAAVVLALLGTVTTATVGVRERAAEFALLQAVGTSMRQVRSWLAIEVGVVVVTGLVAGGLLGAGLVWALLPTIGLAADGTVAVPQPVVVVPVGQLALAVVLVVSAFAMVPLALARTVSRAHVAEVLRVGEDG